MKILISPVNNFSGIVSTPPSKSITQRVYAGALLHHGTTIIHNAGKSDDEQTALKIIEQLGANIKYRNANDFSQSYSTSSFLEVKSNGIQINDNNILCNECGLSARMFTPIAALSGTELTMYGKGRLLNRPMDDIFPALAELGVTTSSLNKFLPILLSGKLQIKSFTYNSVYGSQFLTGLLFAYAFSATETVVIKVKNLKSKLYIDLTLDVLKSFGRPILHKNYEEFEINPSLFHDIIDIEYNIEADWSSASNFLVAGAISGDVTLLNLKSNSLQPDKVILDILIGIGARIDTTEDSISIKKSSLLPFDFDATDCPDLFPILAILAASCRGESSIKGLHRLFDKESNRVESISEMLYKFGIHFSMEDDTLFVSETSKFADTDIDSFNDHRIVMAAAVGALKASNYVNISGSQCVSKSYPQFFLDFAKCNVDIRSLS